VYYDYMGQLEKASRKRSKKANIQKAILSTVFALGGLSVALVAPKMTKVLAQIEPQFMKNKFGKYSVNRSWNRLKNEGLIIFEQTKNGTFARLTPKGETKLRQFELKDYQFERPRCWDGKWRMLIFDVKEKRKNTREKIRSTLKQIGFHYLQDSVWIFPYDCEDLVMLLKADFKIGKDLLYVIADSIENDRRIREVFNLPC